MDLPEILTLSEVAKYLRVNYHTVYRLVKSGRLPAFKAGRSWRFHRADVERYVTYKYHIFGRTGVRSCFFRAKVLQKYLNDKDQKKYYIFDEAFSGKLGSIKLYYDWKEGKIDSKDNFVEVHYNKVRLNMAKTGEPHRWELLVVLSPQEYEKISSVAEEYKHWEKYRVHHLTRPSSLR